MKVIKFCGLCLICLLFNSCASNKDGIPVEVEFEGTISKYYTVENAIIKFEESEGLFGPTFNTTIDFDLVRNDEPFKVDPSTYKYAGPAVVGLGSDPECGSWCMFLNVFNSQYDNLGCCGGAASKLFQHFTSTGSICHLTFNTSINDIYRKGTVDDVNQFLDGKQEFHFTLEGLLCEDGISEAENMFSKFGTDFQSYPVKSIDVKKYSDIPSLIYDDVKYVKCPKCNNYAINVADGCGASSFACTFCEICYNYFYNESEIEVDEPVAEKSESNADWDSILDDYERMIDQYGVFIKKLNNHDTSAMTEYLSCLEKLNSMTEKFSAAESNMSSSQLIRYAKLTQKMATMASNVKF